MNLNELTSLFEKYDIDKDGMLNEAEFLSIFKIIESNSLNLKFKFSIDNE